MWHCVSAATLAVTAVPAAALVPPQGALGLQSPDTDTITAQNWNLVFFEINDLLKFLVFANLKISSVLGIILMILNLYATQSTI